MIPGQDTRLWVVGSVQGPRACEREPIAVSLPPEGPSHEAGLRYPHQGLGAHCLPPGKGRVLWVALSMLLERVDCLVRLQEVASCPPISELLCVCGVCVCFLRLCCRRCCWWWGCQETALGFLLIKSVPGGSSLEQPGGPGLLGPAWFWPCLGPLGSSFLGFSRQVHALCTPGTREDLGLFQVTPRLGLGDFGHLNPKPLERMLSGPLPLQKGPEGRKDPRLRVADPKISLQV